MSLAQQVINLFISQFLTYQGTHNSNIFSTILILIFIRVLHLLFQLYFWSWDLIILVISHNYDVFFHFYFFNDLLLFDINILRDVYKLLLSTRLMLNFLNVVNLLGDWYDLIRLDSIDDLTLLLVLFIAVRFV